MPTSWRSSTSPRARRWAVGSSGSLGGNRSQRVPGAFAASYLNASRLRNVTLASADTDNAHKPFAFVFDKAFAGLTVKNPKLAYDAAAGGMQVLAGDLEVEQR